MTNALERKSILQVCLERAGCFCEVDEGTAVFKVTSLPPAQGHFLGFEGLPSDWYLRLVGEAAKRLHEKQPIPLKIPLIP